VKANGSDTVPIKCPKCDHEFEKTMDWLQENPTFPCEGGCGFGFEANQFIMGFLDRQEKRPHVPHPADSPGGVGE
jgi:hypothetical protein